MSTQSAPHASMEDRPYAGLKVVDLSQGIAGPYCAMLLAQHGADVIKVEPLEGDWSRVLGSVYGDNTSFSIAGNLGKRAIAVDLKTADGRAIVDRLIPKADVFLEGFRPGVIDRLGFAYDRLKAINPGLIYVSISGFGQQGPLSSKPAMDPVLQAFSGFMSENKGPDGIPHRSLTIIVDMSTALYGHQAVAAALYGRTRHLPGRHLDVSLMQAAANLQIVRLMSSYREGEPKLAAAPGGTFKTTNGWIQIAVVSDRDFQGLCKVLELTDVAADPRYASNGQRVAHAPVLVAAVAGVLATDTSQAWRDRLTGAGLQNEVLQTYREFVDHPHTAATGLISHLVQPGSDLPWPVPNPPGIAKLKAGSPAAHAPRKGEHTREVLLEIGYSASEIAAFAERKVIGL
jgi:CoA:oxalate CoA-transferase